MSDRGETSRTASSKSRRNDETTIQERPPLDAWAPSNSIEQIPDKDGMRFRWVREFVNGQEDARNVQMHIREKYERVRVQDLPENVYVEEDRKGDGFARWGGLILMRIPIEYAKQREQYYLNRSEKARFSADQLHGVAGNNTVVEDRGSRSLDGAEAGRQLAHMSKT